MSTADHRLRALDTPAGFGLPMRLIFGITGPRNHVLGTELAGVVEVILRNRVLLVFLMFMDPRGRHKI